MRLQTLAGKDFILPPDFYPEKTLYNIMLSDVGDQTAPLTLPPVPENLELIGWSNRLDTIYKPMTDIGCVVSFGPVVKQCNLGIHSADDVEGISCTLYFDTADFYSLMDEKMLASLPWPVIGSSVGELVAMFKTQHTAATPECVFGVMPIATKNEYTVKVAGVERTGLFILNAYDRWNSELNVAVANPTLSRFEGEWAQTQVIEGADVPTPVGYGMTAFLKLRFVLETIFAGYTLDMTSLGDMYAIYQHDIFVLNNVADAICGGKLYTRQLLPKVTVKAFIAEIEKSFAGKFIFSTGKKVKFYTYNNLLAVNAIPKTDITHYLVTKPRKLPTEFKKYQVVNTLDNNSALDTSGEKLEKIEFSLLPQVIIEDSFKAVEYNTHLPITIRLTMLQIDNVVHLNSALQVDGKPVGETNEVSSEIRLLHRIQGNGLTSSSCVWNTVHNKNVYYRPSRLAFSGLQNVSPVSYLQAIYANYCDHNERSNIAVECDIKLPVSLLYSLDFSEQVLMNGQRYIIEKIKCSLRENTIQTITLRTVKRYLERT